MKVDILTLDGKKSGNIDLPEAIFGVEPRGDILQRVIRWQLAKRRAGTHAVKFRSDISRTSAKWIRQKGSGRARHGSRRANIFVGGGRAFGPIPRDHGYSLPKKIRKMGLISALSSKLGDKKLIVVDSLTAKDSKTKALRDQLGKLGVSSALFVDGPEVDAGFLKALRNLPNMDVLPSQGLNVYDVLRRDVLVLSKAAVEKIGERLQ